MAEFLFFVLIVVLVIRWWVLSRRYSDLEERIDVILRGRVDADEVSRLRCRVSQLEATVAGLTEPPPPAEAAPSPVMTPAMPEPTPEVEVEPSPEPVTEPQVPVVAEPLPAPPLLEQPRAARSSAEWEAVVGGNWLNKLGILVLVIAIALFLGYSFTQLGPAGRSGIGLAVSLLLLGGGVVLERRERYAVFGRGLLAGGWAGLYFTTYAMQSVEAAKVMDNPLLGGFLLLAVAAGMVVHSLRYRVQAVTGLAYFVAFATLAITPVTALSVIALIPLAGSLLVIAERFHWPKLALFALVATYLTCASRGDQGAPLWKAQTVFAIYWLLFEAYDLLRVRRGSNAWPESAMLPLNAVGAGTLSYFKWSASAPAELYLLALGLSAAYLVSTVARWRLRSPASFAEGTGTLARIFAGSYEGPVTLAAASSAVAAALRLHGQVVSGVLLAEGEVLFLASLYLGQDYLRRLATVVFGALGLKLWLGDLPGTANVRFGGWMLRDWTPTAAVASLLLYVDRRLCRSAIAYGYAASALVVLIVGVELPLRYLGMGWLAVAVALFLFGWRYRLFEFRMQGYLAGLLCVGAMVAGEVRVAGGNVVSLGLAAVAAYAAALCAGRSAADRWNGDENIRLEFFSAVAATTASAAVLWRVAPPVYLGPAWMALAIAMLELGLRRLPPAFGWHAYLLALLGAAQAGRLEVFQRDVVATMEERISVGCIALLSYAFAVRLFHTSPDQADEVSARRGVDIASACGSLFVVAELWMLLAPASIGPAWALFAVALLVGARLVDVESLRRQSFVVAALVFFRTLALEFSDPEVFPNVAARIAAGAVAALCLFGAQLLVPRAMAKARLYFSLLSTALVTALLYQEVSGSVLTVAWGVEGAGLLLAGFPLRERTLRLSGIVLFLVCVGKLFLYDLRQLETLYRILSFFVLGVILVGVSWLYTRYREQIQRYF